MSPIVYLITLAMAPTGQAALRKGVTDSFMAIRYLFSCAIADKDEDLEVTRRQSLAKDKHVRDALNSSAEKISADAEEVISNIRDKQQQFSRLISDLSEQFAHTEQSSDNFQAIIKAMKDNLNDLGQTTENMATEFATLIKKLDTVTTALQASQTIIAEKGNEISDKADKIAKSAAILSEKTKDEQTKIESTTLAQQNKSYQAQIIKLLQLTQEQTQIIESMASSRRHNGQRYTKFALSYKSAPPNDEPDQKLDSKLEMT